jgi:hypothetical protein
MRPILEHLREESPDFTGLWRKGEKDIETSTTDHSFFFRKF